MSLPAKHFKNDKTFRMNKGRKRKLEKAEKDAQRADEEEEESMIPRAKIENLSFEAAVASSALSLPAKSSKKLIVVLENACLEAVKVGSEYQLLNTDDHFSLMSKRGRDPTEARPDISHSCLMMLLDSPLNKAGMLQVYMHTKSNILIEINPKTRIPRTFKRYSGLMVQLLHKLSVHATNGPEKLMSVIKNPVTQYFPVGVKKVGTSVKAKSLVKIDEFVEDSFKDDDTAVFVIGAMAHGMVDADYVDIQISFSEYPLSGAVACSKVCSAFEKLWGVV